MVRNAHPGVVLFIVLISTKIVVAAADAASDKGEADVLTVNGLVKSGNTYVVSEEADILQAMKSLREIRKEVDKSLNARRQIEVKITANKKIVQDVKKERRELEGRMASVRDAEMHNNMLVRMNVLAVKGNTAIDTLKELEEQLGNVGTDANIKFVDTLMELGSKADAASKKYETLTGDAGVKSALAKINTSANAKLALGPSAEFAAAVAEIRKWRSEVESEAIPMKERGGVHTVEVLINGVSHTMVVDTGASFITLPGEVAEKMNIEPSAEAPTLHMRIADGSVLDAKLIVLKSVRVGRFTLQDVNCVVLQKGLPNPPLLLGNSFLSHFIVKLNRGGGQLFLTEIKKGPAVASTGKPMTEAVNGIANRPGSTGAEEDGSGVTSLKHAGKIMLGFNAYVIKNKGQWPDKLSDVPSFANDPKLLINPTKTGANTGYVYLKPANPRHNTHNTIVLHQEFGPDDKALSVGFADFHVEWLTIEEFKKRWDAAKK